MNGGVDLRLISNQALASYMRFRKTSVRDLARRSGVHRATIGHLRSGARSTCSLENALRIAAALDTDPNTLFIDDRAARVARNVRKIAA